MNRGVGAFGDAGKDLDLQTNQKKKIAMIMEPCVTNMHIKLRHI